MTPSWYDVLDVDPDASTEQVRAAWRAGVADLDPTDRRFRLLNQAAEVLLDPARRAEHDAALAADDDGTADAAGAAPPAGAPETATESTHASVVVEQGGRRGWSRRRSVAAGLPARSTQDEPTGPTPYAGWVPPVWLLAGLAVLVAVLVGVSAYVSRTPTDAGIEAGERSAQSAAEEAATTVLSYDYRDMQASADAASGLLTPSFRRSYDQLFAQLEANAESVQPVVTTEVVSSGVERVSADGDRVSVLVFVNRPTTNARSSTPQVYQDFVTMRMQRVDGDWLVDDMIATPAAQ